MQRIPPALFLSALLLVSGGAFASDHADPVSLLFEQPDRGGRITGLFAFPTSDGRLIVALNTHPGIEPGAELFYDLKPYTFRVFFDLHSRVNFTCASDLARYGGTITAPDQIAADIEIELRLNDDGGLRQEPRVRGLQADEIRLWTGLRDDPFILPRFEGKNVVAMVMSIPFDAFPEGQQNFLIWATSSRTRLWHESQVDHVGRANRTMLPRLDFLNTLDPSRHAAEVRDRMTEPSPAEAFKMNKLEPLLALKHYDAVPDVMIYTRTRDAGFPNGRRLSDDVAALTCEAGDCLLWELSFRKNHQNTDRPTENDRAFLPSFPYLAEPW